MIDYFSLALAHGLILIAVLRMAGNPALDDDPDLPDRKPGKRPAKAPPAGTGPGDA